MQSIVCCVAVRNYQRRQAEYVNKLAAMVRRNLSLPFRFVCVTDDPSGLTADIETIQAPVHLRGAQGWFTKLYLFSPGLFPHGSRVVFFDLDTLVMANIDDFAAYGGPFAMLGGFSREYHGRFGSGIMLWEAGTLDHVWTKWLAQNCPIGDGTDDSWIVSQTNPHPLQQKLPGIVSFKFHKCRDGMPQAARVCVFQRRPKPHDCEAKWVDQVWRL